MQGIIILLILFYSFLCQDVTDAKEFEENEIKSEIQQFSYKAKKTSMVILIVKNGNYNPNVSGTYVVWIKVADNRGYTSVEKQYTIQL